MYKRLALILAATILLAPGAILADDTTPQTQAAPAAELGPDSSAVNGSGGSSADGSTLQGAGTSVLQTTPSDAAGGSPVPAVKLFEDPAAANSDLRVLLSQEADGAPQDSSASDGNNNPVVDILVAVGIVVLGLLAWIFRAPLVRVWYRLFRPRSRA
jgi:hypothetical protein